MLDGTELGGEAAADQLGGRIRRAEFGVLLLERLEFAQERVELTVGDDGGVAHVVAELMFAHLFGEILPALTRLRRSGDGCVRRFTHSLQA